MSKKPKDPGYHKDHKTGKVEKTNPFDGGREFVAVQNGITTEGSAKNMFDFLNKGNFSLNQNIILTIKANDRYEEREYTFGPETGELQERQAPSATSSPVTAQQVVDKAATREVTK